MAKNEHVVIRSACGAAMAVLLFYLVITFGAAAVNLINPNIDPPESALIWVAINIMPTVLGATLVCGILAAGLSSASTFLSLVGFSASNDIFQHSNDPKKQLRSTRYTMIVMGLIIVVLCLVLPTNIFWITYFAGPVFASSWGVVAFMSIWSKRITEAGAFWGMVSGFMGNVIANLLTLFVGVDLPVYMDPILVGGAISLITVLLVSASGSVSLESQNFREQLHKAPTNNQNSQEIARTLIWPKMMIITGVIVVALLINFYAKPYETAIKNYELRLGEQS